MARKRANVKKTTTRKPDVKRRSADEKFDKREIEDRDVNYTAYSKMNDAAWYAQNSQLMSDVASFSYNYPLGTQMPDDNLFTSRYTGQGSVPGICTIHTTPRIGVTGESNDPINVALRNIYSFVRHANSGSTNRYEAPDMMLYLLAMDSAFSFIEMLKRVYGTVLSYSFTNRYFPLAAVRAQGFNFVDLQRNLSDFRAYINTLAVKVGSLCIPSSMSYMARHQWMYSGMYYDTPSNQKAQVYMYVPEAFYFYNLDSDGAGACTLVEFDRNKYASDFCYPETDSNEKSLGWTFEEIVKFGNALIDPLLADQDINTMSGDILKAFGANNVYMIQTIPENYTILPIYSPEVLSQIHNTTLFGRAINPESIEQFSESGQLNPININNSVIQSADKTYLQNIPMTYMVPSPVKPGIFAWDDNSYQTKTDFRKIFNQMANVKRILDFESGPVSPGDAMVATRLMNHAAYFQHNYSDNTEAQTSVRRHGCEDGDGLFRIIGRYNTAGSETAGYMKLWYWAKVGYTEENAWALIHTEDIYSTMLNAAPNDRNAPTIEQIETGDENWLESVIFSGQRKGLLSSFNMHPAVADNFLWVATDGEEELCLYSKGENWPQFDINYYTVLDREDLRQLNETALLSEFNVTQYGRRA